VPLKRDRISDGVYVFTSGLYAEVTATIILTDEGAILVDTLPFPQETRQIRDFAAQRRTKIGYVINTHSHADHIYGTYLFPDAVVIAHYQCRRLMERHAEVALQQAKEQTPALAEVRIRYPELLFNEGMTLRFGGKTVELRHAPGHSKDVITVHVVEDRLLVASDAVMPVPYVVGGDLDDMIHSLQTMKGLSLENLVQGHGEVLLRGEIEETLRREFTTCEWLTGWFASASHAVLPATTSWTSPSRNVVYRAFRWVASFRNFIRPIS